MHRAIPPTFSRRQHPLQEIGGGPPDHITHSPSPELHQKHASCPGRMKLASVLCIHQPQSTCHSPAEQGEAGRGILGLWDEEVKRRSPIREQPPILRPSEIYTRSHLPPRATAGGGWAGVSGYITPREGTAGKHANTYCP